MNTITIFLADDHELIRKLVKETLAEVPDFRIVGEAASGEETIERIQSLRPDVLVTDLIMNGMNGIQVAEQVQKLLPAVSVIICSISAEYGYILSALEAGAKGYVIKDAGIDALVTAIRELNHGGFYLSPPLSKQRLDEFQTIVRGYRKRRQPNRT